MKNVLEKFILYLSKLLLVVLAFSSRLQFNDWKLTHEPQYLNNLQHQNILLVKDFQKVLKLTFTSRRFIHSSHE